MKPIEIIANDLFDKVRSRFSNLQMGDENGAVTANPPDARFFDFDFVIEGNNLGRVSISINDTGNLKIFFSQGITEDADDATQDIWYDFLKEMRFFAKRRLMRFDTRDITKNNLDKTDFQYLAQTGPKDPNMTESQMFGSSKTSKRKVGETLLILRHEGEIDPSVKGARSRKIKNIFIQNAEGERFKCPMPWLPLGRALQRHVFHGGFPHDEAGRDIIETAGKCHQLSAFHKQVSRHTPTMHEDAFKITEKVAAKLQSLRKHMEGLANENYYKAWKEGFQPTEESPVVLDDATMESYKDTFTVKGFNDSLAETFPLIHAIMQEAGEVDLNALVSEAKEDDCTECGMPESRCECDEGSTNEDFDAFESWANSVVEGTVTPDVMIKLKELMASDLQLGASGELISTLQGIGLDDKTAGDLFDALEQMSPDLDSDTIKKIIISKLKEQDPTNSELDQLASPQGQQQAQTQQPAPPEAQLPAPGAEQQPAMAESHAMRIENFGKKLTDLANKLSGGKKKPATVPQRGLPDIVDTDKKMNDIKNGRKTFEGGWNDVEPNGKEKIYAKVQALRDAIRSGKITPNDELKDKVTALLIGKGMDPESAESEWKRVTGQKDEPILDKSMYKTPSGDLEKEIPMDPDGETEDEFLARLHGAKSIGVEKNPTSLGQDEDSIDPEVDPDSQLIEPEAEEEKPKKGTAEDIFNSVIGFLDRAKGTWTKGRDGIIAHCAREFGEQGRKDAEEAIIMLSKKFPMRDKEKDANDIAEMRRLAGMTIIEADGTVTSTPWAKIKKNKNGKPTDPRGVVGRLAKQGKDSASKETKKK